MNTMRWFISLPGAELPGQRLKIQGGLTWKQKLAFSLPLETGGNWRKSPQTISWMPPNGSGDLLTDLNQDGSNFLDLSHDVISLISFVPPPLKIFYFPLRHLATASSLSKNWASTMEISSMIRCRQLVQCCSTPGLWASSMHCSRGAEPEPIPGKRTCGHNVNKPRDGGHGSWMNNKRRHPNRSFCILRFNLKKTCNLRETSETSHTHTHSLNSWLY